jgi:putative nucleotidyltransferase with HDIG domain
MTLDIPASDIAIHELSSVIPPFAEVFAQAIGADCCAIFAYAEDQQSTIALFRYGYEEALLEAHEWTDPLSPRQIAAEEYILETRKPLIRASHEDFEQYPLINPGQEQLEGRLCDVTIPLLWDDHVQGVANLWRRFDKRNFTDEEVQTLLDLGQLAAMTIVFGRQCEQERLQRDRIQTMLEAANISVSGVSIDQVLPNLARAIRTSTQADVCSLYIYAEQQDEILAAYQDGLREDESQMFEDSRNVPVQAVPAERYLRHSLEPYVVRDPESDLASDSLFAQFVREQGISEILLLPIVWQAELIGVVYCWNREQERSFSHSAIETGEAIARQAGGVISRSRLEAAINHQAMESEALLRIGQAVMSSESLPPVLDEIAASLAQLISFDYAYVGMLTEDEKSIRVIREWGHDYDPIRGSRIPLNASVSGAAVRERRLIRSARIIDDPRSWRKVPYGEPITSVIVAPLQYDNRVLGTMMLGRRTPWPFTAREEHLLTLLSQHAAIAIDRVQSREELVRRAERQAYLARIGDLLVASENPVEVLSQIAELTSGVIADGVVIGLAGWKYGSIHWVADSFNDSEIAARLHRGLNALDMDALRERLENVLVSNREQLIQVSSIWNEHRFLREFVDSIDVKHMLALPLYQQERAPGTMILLSRSERTPFQSADIEMGRIVAQRIGDALERQTIKRNHEALLRTSEAFHAQSDISELVRTIAVELEQILPCDQLIIADLKRDQGMLQTQVYRKHGKEATGREFFPMDEGVCGEALKRRQPIMDNTSDLRDSTVYGNRSEQFFYRAEGESALVTPLIVEHDVVGVLFMNRTGHFRFTSSDFETFLLFAGLASAALDRTTLEQHNRELYRASTEVLAAVVDAKDPTTLEHSRHVATYSRELATLMELSPDEIEQIELAGLLHDIGKLGIPDRILRKPGRLTAEEFELIKTHPDRGAKILEWHPALKDLIPMIRHHHESYDGRGYPSGLEGEETPIGASIICVADAFDTITSQRTYQQRRSVEAALEELERCAGRQFHPELVRRFVARVRADRSIVFSAEGCS